MARVQSDDFQAAEIDLKELCNAKFVIYETFDLYKNRVETKRRRDNIKAKIKRFVFYSYAKLEEMCLISRYHYLSISFGCTLWKIHSSQREGEDLWPLVLLERLALLAGERRCQQICRRRIILCLIQHVNFMKKKKNWRASLQHMVSYIQYIPTYTDVVPTYLWPPWRNGNAHSIRA